MEKLIKDCEYLITFTGKLRLLAFNHYTSIKYNEIVTEDIEEAKRFVRSHYNLSDIDLDITDW